MVSSWCILPQQNKLDGYTESSHEALNTRLFLSLEAIEDEGEEEAEEEDKDFVALFETQVPDCDQVGLGRTLEQSKVFFNFLLSLKTTTNKVILALVEFSKLTSSRNMI